MLTREEFKLLFQEDDIPSETAFSELLDQTPILIDTLPTAAVGNLGQVYCVGGVNWRCEEVSSGVYGWVNKNADAAANNYANATNKPLINSVLLNGDKTGDTLKLMSNFSVLATGNDPLALTSRLATEDGGDTFVTVQRTVQDLYDLFDIGNLPKYEKYNNPLLTTAGGVVLWVLSHTCKTKYPIIQIYDKNGELQDSNNLSGLIIVNRMDGTISIEFDSVSNVAANEYYVVLIG